MVPVTIGVPVYNGADLLDESLACLARQTFPDFRALILDNASTDATPEIARAWADRDSRFEHVRQSENVGGVANFRAALLAARSRWFMWRADDDLSADDYLETLYRLAGDSPGCRLAVGNVVSCDLDGGRRKLVEAPHVGDPASTIGRLRLLFAYHPSWFYGLWDRETLANAYLPVCERFPFAYAADHLTLYGPIIDGLVRTTNKTEFIQRTRRTAASPRRGTRMPFSVMVETRRAFRREIRRIRAQRELPLALRAALVASEPFYLERTVPSLLKTARTGLREWLGMAGPRGVGRHFERPR
jgi:glycosyltransferase involved in cell wall biosynthesis